MPPLIPYNLSILLPKTLLYLLLCEPLKQYISLHGIQLWYLVSLLPLPVWILVDQLIYVTRSLLVGLLKLIVQNLRVVHPVATLETPEPHDFVYHVEPLFVDLRALVFFDEELGARLEFLK